MSNIPITNIVIIDIVITNVPITNIVITNIVITNAIFQSAKSPMLSSQVWFQIGAVAWGIDCGNEVSFLLNILTIILSIILFNRRSNRWLYDPNSKNTLVLLLLCHRKVPCVMVLSRVLVLNRFMVLTRVVVWCLCRVTFAWVTRPEHPKGAKDKVERSEGPPAGCWISSMLNKGVQNPSHRIVTS